MYLPFKFVLQVQDYKDSLKTKVIKFKWYSVMIHISAPPLFIKSYTIDLYCLG